MAEAWAGMKEHVIVAEAYSKRMSVLTWSPRSFARVMKSIGKV